MSSWLDILSSGNHSYDGSTSGLSGVTTKLALDQLAGLLLEQQELQVSLATVTAADLACEAHNHYVCDVSGMTAERNATLPVPALSQRIRITIATGDETYELVVKGVATVTINGGTAATEWSRLFMDGETVEFVATSTTNWQVVHDGRIPQKAVLSEDTATQQLTSAAEIAVTLPDTDLNRGMTVASSTVTPRRPGRFKAHFHSNWTMTGLDADTVYAAITVNSVRVINGPTITHEAPDTIDYAGANADGEFDWDTGDGAIGAVMRIAGAVSPWPTVSVAAGHPPQLIVEEDLTSIGAGVVTINVTDGGGGASLILTTAAPTTANIEAARGNHYIVDASGLTADRDFILPAPVAAGERVRVTLETADDTYALLIKGASVSIQGGTAGVEWSRLVVDNESVEFVATTTSNWIVVYDGRIPLKGVYTEDTSTQTLGTAGEEAVALSDIDLNRGMTMSAGTITPRRTGRYKVNFHSNWAKDTLDAQMVYAAAFVDITKVLQSPMVVHDATNTVDNAGAQVIGEVDWTIGDGDFNVKARAEGGASPWPTLVVSPPPQFIVEEDLKTAGGSVIAGGGGGGGGGGLTFQADTVTTSNLSGVEGYHHVVTIAGLTAHRDCVLPAPSEAGKSLKISIADGDDTYALVIKGTTGVTINGGTAATEWSRLFQQKESVELISTSTTNWLVVNDGRISTFVEATQSTATTLTNSAPVQIEFDTSSIDHGGLHDAVNDAFIPRRSGPYQLEVSYSCSVTNSSYTLLMVPAWTPDEGSTLYYGPYFHGGTLNAWRGCNHVTTLEFDIAADTSVEMHLYSVASSGVGTCLAVIGTKAVLREVLG